MFQNWFKFLESFNSDIFNILLILITSLIVIIQIFLKINAKNKEEKISKESFQKNIDIKAVDISNLISLNKLQKKNLSKLKSIKDIKANREDIKERELELEIQDKIQSSEIEIFKEEDEKEETQNKVEIKSELEEITNIINKEANKQTTLIEKEINKPILKTNKIKETLAIKKEIKKAKYYFPHLKIENNIISRYEDVSRIKKLFEYKNIILIEGNEISGKSHLANIFAKDIRITQGKGVLSFCFNEEQRDLKEALILILIEQLKVNLTNNENILNNFLNEINDEYLIIFDNIEFLSEESLLDLEKLFGTKSKILLINNISENSLKIKNLINKENILKIEKLLPLEIQNYIIEKFPEFSSFNKDFIIKTIDFTEGNPLLISLLRGFCEHHLKHISDQNIFEIISKFDNNNPDETNIIASPVNLYKVLNIVFEYIKDFEIQILNLFANAPCEYLSLSKISEILSVSKHRVEEIIDSLKNRALIYELYTEAFNERCFVMHRELKKFIKLKFKNKQLLLKEEELNLRFAKYYLKLCTTNNINNEVLKKEKIFNLVRGLIFTNNYIIRNNNFKNLGANSAQIINFLEFSLKYFNVLFLHNTIESNLIELYKTNMNIAQSKEESLFFLNLLAKAYLFCVNSQKLDKKIEFLNNVIMLFESANEFYRKQQNLLALKENFYYLGRANAEIFHLLKQEDYLNKAMLSFYEACEISGIDKELSEELILKNSLLPFIELADLFIIKYKDFDEKDALAKAFKLYEYAVSSNNFEFLEIDEKIKILNNYAKIILIFNKEKPLIANLEKVLDVYKQLLSFSPINSNFSIYNQIASCYWKLYKLEETNKDNLNLAIENYKKALSLYENHISIIKKINLLNNLVVCYKALFISTKKYRCITKALEYLEMAFDEVQTINNLELIEIIKKHFSSLKNISELRIINDAYNEEKHKISIDKINQKIYGTLLVS